MFKKNKTSPHLKRALIALHASEISVGDLNPGRCLFDGPGMLKLNNLSCAHYEAEELDSVYQSVLEELGNTGGIEADSLDGEYQLVGSRKLFQLGE